VTAGPDGTGRLRMGFEDFEWEAKRDAYRKFSMAAWLTRDIRSKNYSAGPLVAYDGSYSATRGSARPR
jgi:hypothetical protein